MERAPGLRTPIFFGGPLGCAGPRSKGQFRGRPAAWCRDAQQPLDQLGALAKASLLAGTHFHVREVNFDLLRHPRQRHGEREEGRSR
jgi:hypothetical protein